MAWAKGRIQWSWLVVAVALGSFPTVNHAAANKGVCAPILARLLPGEYHYCVAVHDWQRGANHSGFVEAKTAAAWGEKRAQFALGVDYFNGRRGLATNHIQGLAWLTFAAERKDPYYLSILASARAQATAGERKQAAALVAQMRPRYGDAYVVDDVERHYRTQLWGIRDQIWGVLGTADQDPWANTTVMYIDGMGVVQPLVALQRLQKAGDTYFQGWGGDVTVGPLVPVNFSPESASK